MQHYIALAKTFGNEYASAIMQFTEAYYQSGNDFISEVPEFGIYGMTSPVLGCAVSKTDTGFTDLCFNVMFDFTGRMVPNDRYVHSRLSVLPYKIDNKKLILLEDYRVTEVFDFTPNIMAFDISPFKKAIEAIQWERLDILKTIIEKHPEVIEQKGTNNATLILIAASRNTSLEYLLSLSSKNINEITNDGYTPIMLAILADNIERAEILIRHGARIDSYSQSGYSAKSIEYWLKNYYVVGEEKKSHIMMRLNKAVAKQHL